MEDEAIIALYLRREESAIAETDQKYGAYCGTIARNILSLTEDAEECVNDTWFRAWNEIPPTLPRCLRTFLGRITRNLAISRYRAARAQKRYQGMELMLSELEDCVASGQNVEKTAERHVLGKTLSDWLDGLPEADRRIFVRRYWYGVSVADLAAETGSSENLMAQRLFRLRKRLRERLEKEELI